MKTLFTICLWPMAIIGLGILAASTVALFRAGWDIGQDLIHWLRQIYQHWRK